VHGIDASPAFIALARSRAHAATFRVGSFADAALPGDCHATLAIGEVLGYLAAARGRRAALDRVLARVARALRPGGLLLFDLPGPGRARAAGARTWTEGDGWAVLLETADAGDELTREIVTYRDLGGGAFRRADETHRLRLHRPADVLAALRAAGFAARTLRPGYAREPMPPGITAYRGRKRERLARAEPLVEVRDGRPKRSLDRTADQHAVEEAARPWTRGVLDHPAVGEPAPAVVCEVALVPGIGQARLLTLVLDQAVGLQAPEGHRHLRLPAEQPEDEPGLVAGSAPPRPWFDSDEAGPVLVPVVEVGDVVEAVLQAHREPVRKLDA
jgi:SAM-dependent methyltransferase